MKPQTILKLAALAALLLVVVLVQVVKSIDVDQYRGLVARWMLTQTGREVAFAGPLTLKMSLRPALVADGVSLAGRPGGAKADMIRLNHVEAEIGFLPLLSGEVRIDRIWVDGAEIELEADRSGHGNWEFAASHSANPASELEFPATNIRVTQLVLDHAIFHIQNGDEHRLVIEHATLESDSSAAPMALTLDGQWDGRHLAASGILGSVKELLGLGKAFPLQMKVLLPGLVASLSGSLKSDAQQGLTMTMATTVEVADSIDLDPLLGIPLPSLGSARAAMTLSGRLDHPHITAIDATIGRHDALAITVKGSIDDPLGGNGVELALTADGDAAASLGVAGQTGAIPLALSGHVSSNGMGAERGWRIADLKGSLGRSDLTGQLSLRRRNGHGVIDGRFDSTLVDLTHTHDAAAIDTPRATPGEGRIFSDTPLPLNYLLDSEGHLSWRIGRLLDRRLDAADIALDLAWHDAVVTADASAGSLAGGKAESHVSFDGGAKPAVAAFDLAVTHLALGDLLSSLALSDAITGGRLDFRLKAAGSGDNPRAIMASLQGRSLLAMAPTTFANRLAQDGLGAVLIHLSPTIAADNSEMRCLISHFTLADGLARSEALLFTFGPTTVTGQGSVNLVNESLDFTLTPRPASQNATMPLDIGGSLSHPLVTPNKGAIVKNLPAVSNGGDSPLLNLAANDGNPCFAALAQSKKTRIGGGGSR